MTQKSQNSMKTSILFLSFWTIFFSELIACTEGMTSTEEDAKTIRDAQYISLSRIVGARYEKGTVFYTYKVITSIKGEVVDGEIVGGPLGSSEEYLRDFDRHKDPKFWQKFGGRMVPKLSGRIDPSFDVGSVFLIFHDQPYHRKSFEYIALYNGPEDRQDAWLLFAKKHTK